MTLWDIISTILDCLNWICNWRFNICLWSGALFAFVMLNAIPYEPLRWIVAGFVFVGGIVLGIWWDRTR